MTHHERQLRSGSVGPELAEPTVARSVGDLEGVVGRENQKPGFVRVRGVAPVACGVVAEQGGPAQAVREGFSQRRHEAHVRWCEVRPLRFAQEREAHPTFLRSR